MILSRLSIRGKLNMLLVLALAAVLLVAIPFVLGQVAAARSAERTADTARQAQALGSLMWELQRERLVTAAYLASPTAGEAEMVRQQRVVDDAADKVRSALGADASDELAAALVRLGSLTEVRQNALRRGVSPDAVARTFHAVIDALVESLRLVPQKTGDAEGTRQLTALDALLRANEYGTLRGMALIATAVDPQTGTVVLQDAGAQAPLFTEQFVEQTDVEHAGVVVQVDQGEAAQRVNALATQIADGRTPINRDAFVSDVFRTVEAQSALRRSAQDQVTSQIADAATARATDASRVAWTIGLSAALLFALLAALALVLSRSIANPLRRLTTAATTVADLADTELVRVADSEEGDDRVPKLTAIDVTSSDELGELAAAFNRVQSTATELVERQAISRHNVSLMFANVAQRTQNLVGRQLALVDELERNEQDAEVLASLWRLDHLSTRLRRTADNLLVVAGTRETRIAGPTGLAVNLRSALAEIEDYQRVQLGEIVEIIIGSLLGPDLVLISAELLENATSFSPPQSTVEVTTQLLPDGGCRIAIIDHGIGMTPEQLAQENERLIERERLEIAPTSVLGLFVVGRLARRHSLTVRLTSTSGGGVTAEVIVPSNLFTPAVVPERVPEPSVGAAIAPTTTRPASLLSIPELNIPAPRQSGEFPWFAAPAAAPAAATRPVATPPVTTADPPTIVVPSAAARVPSEATASRAGLKRRVAGAQLPDDAPFGRANAAAAAPGRDAVAMRSALDGFQSAVADVGRPNPPGPAVAMPQQRGSADGLYRRIPGANLAPSLHDRPGGPRPIPAGTSAVLRDPEADRAALDAFTDGLTRALSTTDIELPTPEARRGNCPDGESTKGIEQ